MINQNWVFSTNCGLDFSTDPPTPFVSKMSPRSEGCASISDDNGNLLFYTDGVKIWNNEGQIDGEDLKGNLSSTQSALIVPVPGNSNEYYVFTSDGSTSEEPVSNRFDGIRINVKTWVRTPMRDYILEPDWSIIDSGRFSPVEKLIAVQHENCKDFWVINMVQLTGGNGALVGAGFFRIFLVSSEGIRHIRDIEMGEKIHDIGYMKASPNGQWLAMANGDLSSILIYPFNKATGSVTLPGLIKITLDESNIYGLEFSPNSDVLYFANLVRREVWNEKSKDGRLYQVDFTNSTDPKLIKSFPDADKGGHYIIGALQLGPDGVIYIAKDGEKSLAAIINPDIVWETLVKEVYVSLPEKCGLGLPNLIANLCEDDCDCNCIQLDSIKFHIKNRKSY